MKKYLLLTVCLVAAIGLVWAAGAKTAGKAQDAGRKSLTFNGKEFFLVYSVKGSEWLNEYLPAGQTFKNYTEMIAVRAYDDLKGKATPVQIAQAIASNYQRKYPGIKFLLAGNEKTGDGLVSFVMIQGDILEHNLFRTTLGEGGPVSIQHVYRKYVPQAKRTPADLKGFSSQIKQNRDAWINALDAMPVPAVNRTVIVEQL